MTTEDRLRRAIADRTDHVEPASDGLANIEETLMQPTPMSHRNKWMMGGAAAVVVALVAVAALALTKDDDAPQGVATDPAVTTTVAPQVTVTTASPPGTATTAPPASEPTATTVPGGLGLSESDATTVVWPRPGHEARFDDPVDAVRSFAVFYAGFTDPAVGSFTEGSVYPDEAIPPYDPDRAGHGSVEVRPDMDPSSPVTTVQVRLMDDDHWYVVGATTPDISFETLGSDGAGTCPADLHLVGFALAFEGHVDIRVDSFGPDGSRSEIGRGSATGSGVPPAGRFETDVACDDVVSSGPGSDPGVVVMMWEDSARDGQRRALTVHPLWIAKPG